MACAYLMGGLSLSSDVLRMYGFMMIVCTQLTVIGLLVGTWSAALAFAAMEIIRLDKEKAADSRP